LSTWMLQRVSTGHSTLPKSETCCTQHAAQCVQPASSDTMTAQ
jgi:hypothetical protein